MPCLDIVFQENHHLQQETISFNVQIDGFVQDCSISSVLASTYFTAYVNGSWKETVSNPYDKVIKYHLTSILIYIKVTAFINDMMEILDIHYGNGPFCKFLGLFLQMIHWWQICKAGEMINLFTETECCRSNLMSYHAIVHVPE